MVKVNDIINDIGKYHYLLVAGNKSLLLSSNNNKKEAKAKALKKIENKIDKLKGHVLYQIKLQGISSKKLEDDKKATIPKLGGPIVAIITNYIIESKNSLNKESCENSIFFTKKFLKNNNQIKEVDIKKIAYAHDKHLAECLFSINTIETINKQL